MLESGNKLRISRLSSLSDKKEGKTDNLQGHITQKFQQLLIVKLCQVARGQKRVDRGWVMWSGAGSNMKCVWACATKYETPWEKKQWKLFRGVCYALPTGFSIDCDHGTFLSS